MDANAVFVPSSKLTRPRLEKNRAWYFSPLSPEKKQSAGLYEPTGDDVQVAFGQRPTQHCEVTKQVACEPQSNEFCGVLRIRLGRCAVFENGDDERRIYASLRLAYGEYRRRLESGKSQFWVDRVRWLLLNESCEEDLDKACAELTAEAAATTASIEEVYTTWNQLKGLRRHRGSATTPAKLVAVNFVLPNRKENGHLVEKLRDLASHSSPPRSTQLAACANAWSELEKKQGLALKLRSTGRTDEMGPYQGAGGPGAKWYAVVSVDGARCFSSRPVPIDPLTDCFDLNAGPIDVRMRNQPAEVSIALKLRRPWQPDRTIVVASCAPPRSDGFTQWLNATSEIVPPEDDDDDNDFAPGEEVELKEEDNTWAPAKIEGILPRRCWRRRLFVVRVDNERREVPRSMLRRGRVDVLSKKRLSASFLCELSYERLDRREEMLQRTQIPARRHDPDALKATKFDPNDPENVSLLDDVSSKPASNSFLVSASLTTRGIHLQRLSSRLLPARLAALRTKCPHLLSHPVPATPADVTYDDQRLLWSEEKELNTCDDRLDDYATRAGDAAASDAERGGGTGSVVKSAVLEPQLAKSATTMLLNDMVWRRRRALRPHRRRLRRDALAGDTCGLLVQVVSATRPKQTVGFKKVSDDEKRKSLLAAAEAAWASRGQLTSIGGYVAEATLQEHTRRTNVSRADRWKETLDLPFVTTCPISKLGTVEDRFSLCVFSENESRKSFVGYLHLTFGNAYSGAIVNGCLEGFFELTEPLSAAEQSETIPDRDPTLLCSCAESSRQHVKRRSNSASFARLAIYARPLPRQTRGCDFLYAFSRIEAKGVARYASTWARELRIYLDSLETSGVFNLDPRLASRRIEATAMTMSGDAALFCRFLRPLRLGKLYSEAPARAARFVSLVPYPDDRRRSKPAEVWIDSQEFLDVGAGDAAAHGILLHNVLAATVCEKDETMLVIGCSLDEPRAVFVLQRPRGVSSPTHVLLWNPRTGVPWLADDHKCPLVDIGCLVTPRNIYANLQYRSAPHELSFDLANRNKWWPLFDDEIETIHHNCCFDPGPRLMTRPGRLTSLQPAELQLSPPDIREAAKIQNDLEDLIKRSIRKWRALEQDAGSASHTSFAIDMSRKLKLLLPILESETQDNPLAIDRLKASHSAHVAREYNGQIYELDALAFNFANVHQNLILDRLKQTRLHTLSRPDCQFIVATHVQALPHKVFSIWVYYGSVCPKLNLGGGHEEAPYSRRRSRAPSRPQLV